MRLSHVCIAALALSLAACSSAPKGPPRWSPNKEEPRDENFNGGPNALLLKYDSNHDGTLTRDELVAGLKAEFAALDTNHNNCLNADQTAAINQARIAQDRSTATLLQDWNQDGCIDIREFSTTAYSLFDQLDRNGDGKITPQEFNPGGRGAAGQGNGQGGGRRGGGREGGNGQGGGGRLPQ